MTLGEKIRSARLDAQLSQRQLCEGIVTRNMLSQIENGSAKPSLTTLQALAQRLGRPLSYFLEEAQAPQLQNDDLLISWAMAAIHAGALERAAHLLAAVEVTESAFWHLAKGCLLTAQGDYAAALAHLHRGESQDAAKAWACLEICCRETGDFKGAYQYACQLRELK